jgi:hypothetical protein
MSSGGKGAVFTLADAHMDVDRDGDVYMYEYGEVIEWSEGARIPELRINN